MKHSKRRELKTAYRGTAGLSVIHGSAVTWFYSFLYLKQEKISLEKSVCAVIACQKGSVLLLKKKKKITDVYDTSIYDLLTEMWNTVKNVSHLSF